MHILTFSTLKIIGKSSIKFTPIMAFEWRLCKIKCSARSPTIWFTFLAQHILVAPAALDSHPVHRIKCENAKNCRTLRFFFLRVPTCVLALALLLQRKKWKKYCNFVTVLREFLHRFYTIVVAVCVCVWVSECECASGFAVCLSTFRTLKNIHKVGSRLSKHEKCKMISSDDDLALGIARSIASLTSPALV